MNPPLAENVHRPKRLLTGNPQEDVGVFLSYIDHERGFCQKALEDGRSDGAMNALRALQNYLTGAIAECAKLGVAV